MCMVFYKVEVIIVTRLVEDRRITAFVFHFIILDSEGYSYASNEVHVIKTTSKRLRFIRLHVAIE
ncbi:MAG: hypothetical protein ACW96N_06320 [Candidatus Thorarchaeota archaeon]|jgi:hypothetical protein